MDGPEYLARRLPSYKDLILLKAKVTLLPVQFLTPIPGACEKIVDQDWSRFSKSHFVARGHLY